MGTILKEVVGIEGVAINKMKGFYIEITNNLLDPKHVKRMGAAVWEYMWCLDKITSITEEGIGNVLGGKPIRLEELAEELGKHENSISKNLTKLEEGKYICLTRAPYGLIITVNKAKKIFGKRERSTQNSESLKSLGDSHKTVDLIKTKAVTKEKYNKKKVLSNGTKKIKSPLDKKKRNVVKSPYGSVDFLKQLSPDYIKRVGESYNLPLDFVKSEAEKAYNYCQYKGRKYKDYNLFLINWVKNSWERLPDYAKQKNRKSLSEIMIDYVTKK